MVEYGTVQFVDFVHGPIDLMLMGENGLYLYMDEMVIKKEKKNRVNLYVKAILYAYNDALTFLLLVH
jgi:hypothetical protein